MKKIFLLSLLSVLFLSAFCQVSAGSTEVLTKINITRSIDIEEMNEIGFGNEQIEPIWWFFYRNIVVEPSPDGGITIQCNGFGWKICMLPLKNIFRLIFKRGLVSEAMTETMESTCQNLVEDSDEQAANGVYRGTITKKIAFSDPEINGRNSYLLFQMNWDYDPQSPSNGTAEIIISKTNNFGLR